VRAESKASTAEQGIALQCREGGCDPLQAGREASRYRSFGCPAAEGAAGREGQAKADAGGANAAPDPNASKGSDWHDLSSDFMRGFTVRR